jgi:uncharacterized protein
MQQAVDLAGTNGVSFHLQLTGGEPALVSPLIETSAALARKIGRCHTIGIQTNGTCLSRKILTIFKKYDIQVGVNLDGPPQVHQNERGMAAQTLRGLRLLESAGIPFRVTTVVTQANAAKLDELVLILAGYSMARGIGLDLLVRKGRALNKDGALPADHPTLEKGLQRMGATLNAVNIRRAVSIQWREWDLLFPNGNSPKRPSGFCHAGLDQSIAVTPDGRIFPCAQTLEDERFAAGTVRLLHGERLSRLKMYRAPSAPCVDCEVSAICPGDCPSRLYYNQNRYSSLICVLYRTLYRMGNTFMQNKPKSGSAP